jgi:hypothetical protein
MHIDEPCANYFIMAISAAIVVDNRAAPSATVTGLDRITAAPIRA